MAKVIQLLGMEQVGTQTCPPYLGSGNLPNLCSTSGAQVASHPWRGQEHSECLSPQDVTI